MNRMHQLTSEEEAFYHLLDERWESLSESARSVFQGAATAAYLVYRVHNISFGPPDHAEIMEEVRLAAAGLTDHDRGHLTKIWCAALAAAASIDPDDHETLVGRRVYRADLHGYYRMLSGTVEEMLRDRRTAERVKEVEELQREGVEDFPF